MKYIRTTNAIYEVVKEEEARVIVKGENMNFPYPKGNIVSQADSLNDLIDEKVIDNPDNWEKKPFVSRRTLSTFLGERNAKYQKEHNIKIYGSIWVDCNLIKVAKVNEKGELELL